MIERLTFETGLIRGKLPESLEKSFGTIDARFRAVPDEDRLIIFSIAIGELL
jgi:hypothetical protein